MRAFVNEQSNFSYLPKLNPLEPVRARAALEAAEALDRAELTADLW